MSGRATTSGSTMRAWEIERIGPVDGGGLVLAERPLPEPAPGQVRVRVVACGVCRTDLHLVEGDLAPHRPRAVPGHEVVGFVDRLGVGSERFALGDRVGAAWLARTCGRCRFCASGRENLCLSPSFTGWDIDGGFAEFMVADERYLYPLPDGAAADVAPLLCAGIIGYRALRRADLPPGGALGLYGFGASAHLVAQVALGEGARVHVVTRSADDQRFALEMGASSACGDDGSPPEPLDAAILFAPAGELVPVALAALDRGATLAIAGIHLSEIPALDYDALVFNERTLRSVTANTRADGRQLLATAARLGVSAVTTSYDFTDADRALRDLAHGRFRGAAVVHVSPEARAG